MGHRKNDCGDRFALIPQGVIVSLDKTALVSDAVLENRISRIISEAGLCRPANQFFKEARAIDQVDSLAALRIGLQWQAVAKTFMFTTVSSIGLMARRFNAEAAPDRDVLAGFQKAYKVIGYDLANFAPQFSAVCPQGVAGMHYIWWADTIVQPLADVVGPNLAVAAGDPLPGVAALLANMTRLADSPLGAAVQLRVVEAIALDIAVAFRRMYGKVLVDGIRLYTRPGALDWVDSHIKAETSHARSVSENETGMTVIAATETDRRKMLRLTEDYTANWARTLDDFAVILTGTAQ
jgi:hypothetical protein